MADSSPGSLTPKAARAGLPGDFAAGGNVDLGSDSPEDTIVAVVSSSTDRSSSTQTSGSRVAAAAQYAGEPAGQGGIDLSSEPSSAGLAPSHSESYSEPESYNIKPKSHGPYYLPPSRRDVLASLPSLGLPATIHPKPHCSRREDAGGSLHPNEGRAGGGGKNQVGTVGRSLHLEHDGLLPPWPGENF